MKELYFTLPYRRSKKTVRLEYGQVKKKFLCRTYDGEIIGRKTSEDSPKEEVFEGELESGQSFREFEGHEWDAAEAGKFDYLPEEAMREESRKVRIEEGKVSDKEWELEGEGAERSKRAYEAQKQGEPTRDSFLKLYDLVNNKGRDMMDPQTRIDSGMTQRQFDKALKNWDEYKKEFGAVQ